MSNPFTEAFTSIQAAFGGMATATITRGRDSIANVLCSGLEGIRAQDDYGRMIGINGTLRYNETSEPAATPFIEGDVLTVLMDGTSTGQEVRIIGRKAVAGVVRLTVQGEFE